MASVHGRGAAFKLDDSGASLRDLSSYVDNVDFPQTAATAEDTAFGDNSQSFIAGLKTATISISGNFDSQATTGPDVVIQGVVGGSAGTFEFGPEGGTGGDVKYSGECICTSYQAGAPVGDKVSFSAEFQVTGDVTRGTF